MIEESLSQMIEFNNWANEKVRKALESVHSDRLNTQTVYGPFLGMSVHLFAWVEAWIKRIQGENPKKLQSLANYASLAEINTEWRKIDEAFVRWIQGLDADDLKKEFGYTSSDGEKRRAKIRNVVMQLLLHQMYHRGQIAMTFREKNFPPIENVHFIDFLFEKGLW